MIDHPLRPYQRDLIGRAGVWLLPWRSPARVLRRWSIAVATVATRARSAARRVR